MNQADFLQECMSEFKGAPIDAFNREFCMLCSNRECSRSWAHSSVFDARIKNWRTVLFDNVPRLTDPALSNPKFEPMETGKVPEINTPVFETTPLSYEDVPDTDPGSPPASVQTVPPHDLEQTIGHRPSSLEAPIVNTPFDRPVTLGGPEKQEEKAEPGCVFVFEEDE